MNGDKRINYNVVYCFAKYIMKRIILGVGRSIITIIFTKLTLNISA